MADLRTLGATSNRVRFTLKDKTTGQGKTGLSTATTGLIISTITDNEASPTVYTVAGTTIETIATLGTFATPTTNKARFKEVSATNHPGLYEYQFANARFAVTGAKRLVISVNDGQSTILDADYEIQFSNDLVGSILDEVNTGATHNVNNSLGKQIRSLSVNTGVIYTATAPSQAGMTSTQIKLDSGASAIDNVYQWNAISILSGTDAGDSAIVSAYNGTTKVVTVETAWAVQPDATSVFEITPTPKVQTVGSSTANVTSVNGTTFSGANVPSILANSVTHGGAAAILTLLSASVPNGITANLLGSVNSINGPVTISDGSFSIHGFNVSTPGTSDFIESLAIQVDGKIVVSGGATVGGNSVFAVARYNTDGSLDTSFGTSGFNVSTPSTNDYPHSVAIQSDGKIVAGGSAFTGGHPAFAVARYNANGSLDTSFGTSGFTISTNGTSDLIYSVAIQSDGKIVVGGAATVGGKSVFAVARYNTDGTLDTGFATSGFNVSTPGTNNDSLRSIAIQSDGKIVAGGYAVIGGHNVFAVARYNTDGSLDTGFGTSGFNVSTPGTNDNIYSIAIQSDGKIIAGGIKRAGGNPVFALARYNTNGSLDTSFGVSGFAVVSTPGTSDVISSVAIQSDGKIVVGGTATVGGKSGFVVARYNADGSLDTSFGTSGFNVSTPGDSEGIAAIAIQADGKIVAAGYAELAGNDGFAVGRYRINGSLDTANPYTLNLRKLDISNVNGHGISVLATGTGKKAFLLAGDAATDSLAIAAGTGTPIDIFDVTGAVRTTGGGGGAATLDLTQVLSTPRNLGSVADGSLTLNDALHCAVAGAVGKQSISGTTYLVQTPSTGTTLRSFTLDSGTAPRTRT